MSEAREKLATEVNADLLGALHRLAKAEGRQVQSLVEEAIAGLIEERRHGGLGGRARAHVLAAYRSRKQRYSAVYRKLAE